MTLRQIRLALWGLSALLAGLAALSLLWAFWLPLATTRAAAATPSAAPTTRPTAGAAIPPLRSFGPLLTLELRQPLDPNAPTALPTLPVKLAGTILEPGRNMAMFQDKEGAVQLKAVGETIAGAEVRQISESGVVVFYGGQELTLNVEAEKHP